MPHHKSAVKRVKTNRRDQTRNTAVRSTLKTSLKKALQTPEDESIMRDVVSTLDRAARKGVIPKAVANRRKSRLARLRNRLTKAS
jgi:small subunit ribosomal protein S20